MVKLIVLPTILISNCQIFENAPKNDHLKMIFLKFEL